MKESEMIMMVLNDGWFFERNLRELEEAATATNGDEKLQGLKLNLLVQELVEKQEGFCIP